MLEAWMLSSVLDALKGRLAGADAFFDGVGIDSRKIEAGQLFVALPGERFDGHDYLNEVAAKGAAGALVQREVADARALLEAAVAAGDAGAAEPALVWIRAHGVQGVVLRRLEKQVRK